MAVLLLDKDGARKWFASSSLWMFLGAMESVARGDPWGEGDEIAADGP